MGPDGFQGPLRTRDERRRVDALGVLGVTGERGMRGRRRGRQRLGVTEPFGLGGEFDVLSGTRLDTGDLVEAVAQHVGLLGPFTRARGDLVQLDGDGAQSPIRLAVLRERPGDGVPGVPVERLPLPGLLQQPC